MWLKLPSLTTVDRWLKNFKVDCGLLSYCIEVLKAQYSHIEKSTETFLAFDEMALTERWLYDKVKKVRS